MASINVNRAIDDPFYRYKMPAIIAKVEGRGNGIKTVIVNMTEIAKALERPPSYPTKYFGCELGAQTQIDPKGDRYIVNGQHTAEDLQNILDGFISKFVLCPGCDNPETRLSVSKKTINQKCVACGYVGTIVSAHRLVTYILNHPPDSAGTGGKGSKKRGGRKGKDRDNGSADASAPPKSAAHDNVAERAGDGAIAAPDMSEIQVDEDDWCEDTDADAVRAREEEELSGAVAKMVMSEKQELPMAQRLQELYDYVIEHRDDAEFPEEQINSKAELLDCKEKGTMVLVDALLNQEDVVPPLKKYKGLFQRFAEGNTKAQKYMLHAFERVIEAHPSLLDKVSGVFQQLYNLDVVEEDAFVAWDAKITKKYVPKDFCAKIHEKAKPFMEWLTAEDSESESEEEDDADDDIQFSSEVATVKSEVVPSASADPEDGEDDFDIDDI
eukprot:m.12963 g.12963  ORF g.12963 m.12963 type:complete len:440 (+) comp5884_c0_seq1:309-1628(+)